MASDWLEFQKGTQGLSKSLGDYSRGRNKIQDAIQLAMAEAQIKQQFQDPMAQLLDFAKVSKALSDVGIDPRVIFGQGGGAPTAAPSMPTVSPRTDLSRVTDPALRQKIQGREGRGVEPVTPAPTGLTGDILIDRKRAIDTTAELEPTEFKPTTFGGIQPTKYGIKGAEAKKAGLAAAGKVHGEQLKKIIKTQDDLIRIRNASSELVARAKQVVDEIGGYGLKQFARGKFGQAIAKSGFVEGIPLEEQFSGFGGFEGQLVEMTLALSPILTNQNRIIRGIVTMLKKTLPGFPTTEAEFTGKLNQTVKNSFRLSAGLAKNIKSIDEIRRLNNASEQEIQQFIGKSLAEAQFDAEDEKLFNQMWNEIKATPASQPQALTSAVQGGAQNRVGKYTYIIEGE